MGALLSVTTCISQTIEHVIINTDKVGKIYTSFEVFCIAVFKLFFLLPDIYAVFVRRWLCPKNAKRMKKMSLNGLKIQVLYEF